MIVEIDVDSDEYCNDVIPNFVDPSISPVVPLLIMDEFEDKINLKIEMV